MNIFIIILIVIVVVLSPILSFDKNILSNKLIENTESFETFSFNKNSNKKKVHWRNPIASYKLF